MHIFRKDARYLRKELCLFVLLAILYAWAATHAANPVWAELLLAFAAAYLIARLIHAESIPGDKQFWLTRPYNRSSLLIAKILGIVVFLNAPIFAARLYVLCQTGFPIQSTLGPLAWSQFLMFIGAMLPIAALASVTPGIVPFTFVGMILVAIGFAIDTSIAPPSAQAVRLALSSSQWVWNSIALLTLIAFSIPVLYIQYRIRRTFMSRFVILFVGVGGALAYVYVPWPVAAEIQSRVSHQSVGSRALRVSLEPGAKRFFPMGMMWRKDFQVDVPLAVRGIPEDVEVIADAVSLSFQAADGSSWSTGSYIYPALAKEIPGPGAPILNANVDVPQAFFDKAKDQRVSVIGVLYLTLFGNAQATTIPIRSTPVNVSNGMQCSIGVFQQLSCRSAFRWPARLVYANFRDREMLPFTRAVSHSPFPAGLGFDAVESREVPVPGGEHQVTIVVKEPLASLRHDFEIDDFPLLEFSARVVGSKRQE
jgi:hypothetical protein